MPISNELCTKQTITTTRTYTPPLSFPHIVKKNDIFHNVRRVQRSEMQLYQEVALHKTQPSCVYDHLLR